MSTAAMIDLETLSTKQNTVILTLGGVKFDPYSKEDPHTPIYLRIDVDEQLALGRHYDDGTLAWWGRQDKDIREDALGEDGRTSMLDSMKEFHAWVLHSDTIWSNGSVFDIMIMEDFYMLNAWFAPWEYWRIRDVRTVFNMGINPRMSKDSLHNALADADEQARGVQHVFSELGIRPDWEKS